MSNLPPLNTTPSCYNFGPAAFPKWKRALAGLLSGNYRPRIAFLGDSSTAGTGSLVSGALLGPGLKVNSFPSQLAKFFAGNGFAACVESLWGDFGYGANAPVYDARLTLGSWALSGAVRGPGGQTYLAGGATASPLAFVPSTPTDTVEIYFSSGPTTGSFNANINGGANTLKNTSGSSADGKLVISAGLGSNTYNATWSSGGNVFIGGFIAYNSASKQIDIVNMGVGGLTSTQSAATYPSMSNFLAILSPDLTVIDLGINDWLQTIGASTYEANLQTLIAAGLANGDVLLVSPMASGSTVLSPAAQQPYLAALASLAAANNVPYIDLNALWTSFTVANARGFYATDSIHGTYFGYGDKARQIGRMLLG